MAVSTEPEAPPRGDPLTLDRLAGIENVLIENRRAFADAHKEDGVPLPGSDEVVQLLDSIRFVGNCITFAAATITEAIREASGRG